MEKISIMKRVLVVFFIGILFIGMIKNNAFQVMLNFADCITSEENIQASEIDANYTSDIYLKNFFVDLNGLIARILGMHGYYMDIGMYVDDNNHVVTTSAETSTDYEFEQIVDFKKFLDDNNVNLLYVNEPTKYTDDSIFEDQFGIKTYSNQNADKFFARLDEVGIPYIDLRTNLKQEGIEASSLFYRTDHHWTTKAGLWATKIMVDGLNDKCGYHIDTSIYDIDNYEVNEWKNCWLGEYGRKVSVKYVGLDDYWEIKPKFATNYTFINGDGTTFIGTFDTFVNEDIYNTDINPYESPSWHYSYSQRGCVNNMVEDGKVLMLTDSYDCVTEPFISLGVHEVDILTLRDWSEENLNLRDFIIENGYDTVMICYAQFMIGAHDDETSANYRMFTFR